MESLEKKLGYRFRDRSLLAEALSHSSYANEQVGNDALHPLENILHASTSFLSGTIGLLA